MAFMPGVPLPTREQDACPGTLYHVVTAEYRIVTFLLHGGLWYWRFVSGPHPDGNGTWADVQVITQVLTETGR